MIIKLVPYMTLLFILIFILFQVLLKSSETFNLKTVSCIDTAQLWRIYTYSLFHSSWLHVSMNCAIIFIFGTITEFELGKLRFLAIHFVTVLNGAFFTKYESAITHRPITLVGSSAFTLGLIGSTASFLIANWKHLPIEKRLIYSISFFAILGEIINDIYMIVTEQNMYDDIKTSYYSHAGGFLAGVLAAASFSGPNAQQCSENVESKGNKIAKASPLLLLTMLTVGFTFFVVG